MSENTGYACPFCGESSTTVVKTASFSSCIIRSRKCLVCGQVHETTEIALEISKVWRDAASVILGQKIAQIGANASA